MDKEVSDKILKYIELHSDKTVEEIAKRFNAPWQTVSFLMQNKDRLN